MTSTVTNISDIDFVSSLYRRYGLQTLSAILVDRTTKRNIIWADSEYVELGVGYGAYDEITTTKILDRHVIEPRVVKSIDQQAWRTKEHAEVFTPSWLCEQMVDSLDDAFFGSEPAGLDGSTGKGLSRERMESLSKNCRWQSYVDNRLLEISCGEAPFVCSPYDATTGEFVPVDKRIGFLDRKLRVVSAFCTDESDWLKWSKRAVEACYGYEYQGDNLLIARINVLNTYGDYMYASFGRLPDVKEIRPIARIVTWNLWQMDGFTDSVPSESDVPDNNAGRGQGTLCELGLFDDTGIVNEQEKIRFAPKCFIYDWRAGKSQPFETLKG